LTSATAAAAADDDDEDTLQLDKHRTVNNINILLMVIVD
jgi:hypothetical protein